MVSIWAKEIGAFTIWILKGAKTKLKDENIYEDRNRKVGYIVGALILLILSLCGLHL